MVDTYQPKKSTKISKKLQNIAFDNDIWVECVHVFSAKERRTYFRSVNTNGLYWDEPPSGATHVMSRAELKNHPDKRLLEHADEKLVLPHWTDNTTKWNPHIKDVPNTFPNLRDLVGKK
jgi:hypothetical protein